MLHSDYFSLYFSLSLSHSFSLPLSRSPSSSLCMFNFSNFPLKSRPIFSTLHARIVFSFQLIFASSFTYFTLSVYLTLLLPHTNDRDRNACNICSSNERMNTHTKWAWQQSSRTQNKENIQRFNVCGLYRCSLNLPFAIKG